MRRFFLVSFAALATSFAIAVEPSATELSADNQFRAAWEKLATADEARDLHRSQQAVTLYRDALLAYKKLALKYPDWQTAVVTFRINYCNNQIESITKKLGPVQTPAATEAAPGRETQAALEVTKLSARTLLVRGENAAAQKALLEGLMQAPDDLDLRLLLATAQCQAGKYQDAAKLVQQIITEAPSNTDAKVLMATVHFAAGKMTEAEEQLLAALQIDPSMRSAHYNMVRLLLSKTPQDINGAREHYRKAIELGVKPDTSLDYLMKDAN